MLGREKTTPEDTAPPRAVRRWETFAAWAVGVNLLVLLCLIFLSFWVPGATPQLLVRLLPVPGLSLALTAAFFAVLCLKHRRLKVVLRAHDGRVCIQCEYPLPPPPPSTGTCPECGVNYDLDRIARAWRRAGWRG